MSLVNKLFTERFRPKTLNDIVLPDRVLNLVKSGLEQNILLYSSPGLGKTSLSYVLCNEFSVPYIYINASRESSVEVIREHIVGWCSQPSLMPGEYNNVKAVIIDEIEGFSQQSFLALRGTIEQFADEARFIATCNYIEKVPDPIRSRFTCIDLAPENAEEEKEMKVKYYNHTLKILNELGMKTDKEGIIRLADTHFPDLRSLVNSIESLYISGKREFKASDIKEYNVSFIDLYNLMLGKQDPEQTYIFVNANYEKKLDEVLISLGNDFIQYIRETKPEAIRKIPDILVKVADYQYRSKFTIDKMVNLLACIYSLQTILNS